MLAPERAFRTSDPEIPLSQLPNVRPLSLLALLLLAPPLGAQPPGPPDATAPAAPAPNPADKLAGWTLEREQLVKTLTTEKTVRIVNDFGNVYARTGESQVEIATVAQRHESDPYRLLLESRSENGVLLVEVKQRLEDGRQESATTQKRRLDLTLFLPPGVALVVEAEDSIETKKLRSDVDLLARKGHIVLDVYGRPKARAFDSDIRGVLRGTDWTGTTEISTRSGDIQLYFMPEADVAIEATSMGELTTDFSLEIERKPGSRIKTGRAKLNSGKAGLKLFSEIGQIRILLNV